MKAVLTYHSLDSSGSVISLEPRVFESHVRWLASGRVRVLPLEELQRFTGGDDAVAITFDDAIENFASIAAPLLATHALPVTLFVVSGQAGSTNHWSHGADPGVPHLRLLDWDALRALARTGVTLGAHSRSHPRLARTSAADLEAEIVGAADDVERNTGNRPTTFAYPYGSVSADAAAIVRAHYACACTTEMRAVTERDDPILLPRLDSYYFRTPGSLESWGTARFNGYLRVRALARRVRSTVPTLRSRA
ncbi:MAG TPA: polysaccharide deacetylase family protein [Candidatus Elarobacter sp.]|nr:polysaccharide deacetylase family protein [Candidatus Elarobacter sp.]